MLEMGRPDFAAGRKTSKNNFHPEIKIEENTDADIVLVGDRFRINWKNLVHELTDEHGIGLQKKTSGETTFQKPNWL